MLAAKNHAKPKASEVFSFGFLLKPIQKGGPSKQTYPCPQPASGPHWPTHHSEAGSAKRVVFLLGNFPNSQILLPPQRSILTVKPFALFTSCSWAYPERVCSSLVPQPSNRSSRKIRPLAQTRAALWHNLSAHVFKDKRREQIARSRLQREAVRQQLPRPQRCLAAAAELRGGEAAAAQLGAGEALGAEARVPAKPRPGLGSIDVMAALVWLMSLGLRLAPKNHRFLPGSRFGLV